MSRCKGHLFHCFVTDYSIGRITSRRVLKSTRYAELVAEINWYTQICVYCGATKRSHSLKFFEPVQWELKSKAYFVHVAGISYTEAEKS